jgi:hypothetical protein
MLVGQPFVRFGMKDRRGRSAPCCQAPRPNPGLIFTYTRLVGPGASEGGNRIRGNLSLSMSPERPKPITDCSAQTRIVLFLACSNRTAAPGRLPKVARTTGFRGGRGGHRPPCRPGEVAGAVEEVAQSRSAGSNPNPSGPTRVYWSGASAPGSSARTEVCNWAGSTFSRCAHSTRFFGR